MRRHSTSFLAVAFLSLLTACQPAAEEQPDLEATRSVTDEPETPPATDTITIGVDPAGNPTVSQDSVEVRLSQSPVVAWRSRPDIEDRLWVVGFGGGTPFRNGQAVFHADRAANPRAPIDLDTSEGTYKYWVFLADGQGGWSVLDPKLVIIDDLPQE